MASVDASYPPPDAAVHNYFREVNAGILTRMDQAVRYANFFEALFDHAFATLVPSVTTPQALRARLKAGCPERDSFYNHVVSEAEKKCKQKQVCIRCNPLHSRKLIVC